MAILFFILFGVLSYLSNIQECLFIFLFLYFVLGFAAHTIKLKFSQNIGQDLQFCSAHIRQKIGYNFSSKASK